METDVLVVGGGLAGLWAAIAARATGARVLLTDKGKVSKSGCSTFACGNIACPFPEDDISAWKEEIAEVGRGLTHQGWVTTCLTEIFSRVKEMEAFGVAFEKEGNRFQRTGGRGKVVKSVIAHGRQMMQALRAHAVKMGVEVRDRTIILELLVEGERCLGAIGMETRSGEFCIIHSRATILSAGGSGFGGTFYGNKDNTGDSHALAFRAGVEQHGFEFVLHNTTHRDYDTSGMGRFVGHGGKFLNSLGQAFMEREGGKYGNRAPLGLLAVSMAKEVQAGRGPLCLDLRNITAEEEERFLRIMPHMSLILKRAKIDIRKGPMPWVPMSGSTYGMATGCKTDGQGKTTLPGLFAAGGAGGILRGASVGITGTPLMTCCVSGHVAGLNAAHYALGADLKKADRARLNAVKEELLAPLRKEGGLSHHELLLEIQKAVFPYQVMLMKHGARLKKALERLLEIKADLVPSVIGRDIHDTVKVRETKNILLTAEMLLRASLLRTESRGGHFREDFPNEDNENWLKWVIIKQENEKMILQPEAVPTVPE